MDPSVILIGLAVPGTAGLVRSLGTPSGNERDILVRLGGLVRAEGPVR